MKLFYTDCQNMPSRRFPVVYVNILIECLNYNANDLYCVDQIVFRQVIMSSCHCSVPRN